MNDICSTRFVKDAGAKLAHQLGFDAARKERQREKEERSGYCRKQKVGQKQNIIVEDVKEIYMR